MNKCFDWINKKIEKAVHTGPAIIKNKAYKNNISMSCQKNKTVQILY